MAETGARGNATARQDHAELVLPFMILAVIQTIPSE